MISNTVNYGHIIILTGEGIVYQNGAVQTVIVKHYSATDGKIFYKLPVTVKPVLSGHSKIDKTKNLMTNGSLMKVKSIAECSPWSILQYF